MGMTARFYGQAHFLRFIPFMRISCRNAAGSLRSDQNTQRMLSGVDDLGGQSHRDSVWWG